MPVISDFHDSLADFNTSVSVIAPADWISANTKHVLATLPSVGVSGEEYARFAQATVIYPVRDCILFNKALNIKDGLKASAGLCVCACQVLYRQSEVRSSVGVRVCDH